jgi:DNA-binding MarR family transcriptional regulator
MGAMPIERRGVLVLGEPDTRIHLTAAAARAGATVVAEADWSDAASSGMSGAQLVIAALDELADDALHQAVDRLGRLPETEFGLIVTLTESQIDAVAAPLLARRITLLCDPDAADVAAAIAQALIAPAPRPLPASVADQRSDYGLPAEPVQVSAADVRKAIRARRLRSRPFPDVLFEDPAWDMLLDLYAAHLERAQVSVSSLCIASAVPPSTALRWIGRMTEDGLFVREPDPFDRRRAFMALSEAALDRMNRYFATLAQNGLAIA